MKKTLLYLFSALLLCMTLCARAFAAGDEEEETTDPGYETYQIRLFTEPQFIKLPKADTSYWFRIPKDTKLKKASLSLILRTSDTLLEDHATATVEVNGIAISSINLYEYRDTPGIEWNVEIPVERLKTDGTLNQLSILTAQRSIMGDCADIDNPANWLIIDEESAMFLTMDPADVCLLNELYPFLFNRAELGNALDTEMVLAGSDLDTEGAAALTIASAIGANFPYKTIEQLHVGKQKNGEAKSSFLINTNASGSVSLKDGEGYLSVLKDNGINIQVYGGGKEGLAKAVRVLTDSELLSQFSKENVVISTSFEDSAKTLSSRETGLYSLKDFGYDDINLAGAFHQQTYFSIRQPDGILGGPDSYFEVHFRHSDALVGDTSMLTVCFDGVPASSIQLSRSNVDGGKLKVRIPKEVLDKSSFEITVDVYNYLGKIDCSKDWYDVAWTVIDKDSVIYLEPGDNTVYPSLEHFPSMWGDTATVCLPEGCSELLWQSVAALAARSGQNTQQACDYNVVHELSKTNAAESHIIMAGSRSDLKLPSEIADKLYITPNGGSYTIKKDVNTIPEALDDKIIIQVIRSPYNYKKIVYVITWADAAGEMAFADLSLDREKLDSLEGEIALVGANGIVTLSPEKDKSASIPMSPETLLAKIVRDTGIPRVGLFIIAALIILIIILIIRQVLMRQRFAQAKAKLEEENKMLTEEELARESEEEDTKKE
ncbi:MAG: cellulose biosynthesis cyclic di-GMP-binding regulatory protein BcsB [Lachnospiraceae bacterium]|nr:cellulose biosynthesis cyclic di-GMP-binding regulatory protein BcsB [Lachnospiraceae bacterium]